MISVLIEPLELRRLCAATPNLTTSFESFTSKDEADTTPADCDAAAGPEHIVTVVNSRIAFYSKEGSGAYDAKLTDFFDADDTFFFDPRVLYDSHHQRFVVVAAADTPSADQVVVAVSNDADPTDGPSNPQGIWNILTLNVTGRVDHPNVAVGSDAVYINASVEGFFEKEPRLWIVHKTGLYGGTTPVWTVHNPEFAAGVAILTSHFFPTSMFGTPPSGVGTYLVADAVGENSDSGGEDVINVIRVSDPLTTPTFTRFTIALGNDLIAFPSNNGGLSGDLESGYGTMPEPVWRDGSLWATETVDHLPKTEATVHWVRINTASMTLQEQGFIDAEEIAPNTRTTYGSIAVNAAGDAVIGFSATGPNIYAGAYYAIKRAGESSFAAPAALAPGTAPYVLPGPRQRWGDYSATVVDPADDTRFWVYNQYAVDFLGDSRTYRTRVGTFSTTPVVNRRTFYDRSYWDGSRPSAVPPVPDGLEDDSAVAPYKQALLPRQQAKFSNYTSYSKGINGIVVDIKGLPGGVTLTAADFEFRAGNDSNPAAWPLGPTPGGITIRRGAGFGGTDRVTLKWPDYNPQDPNNTSNAVANKWLRVTVKATANTGLSAPDVFYFGNLIGDTGVNSTGLYATLAEDYSITKDWATDERATDPTDEYDPAPAIWSNYDHNRDHVLDDKDYGLVQTNFFKTLLLLTAPV